jgi:hypothetical protein
LSIPYHSSTCLSSIFSISFHNFLLYFPTFFNIQLGFLPYFFISFHYSTWGFFHIFPIFSLFN